MKAKISKSLVIILVGMISTLTSHADETLICHPVTLQADGTFSFPQKEDTTAQVILTKSGSNFYLEQAFTKKYAHLLMKPITGKDFLGQPIDYLQAVDGAFIQILIQTSWGPGYDQHITLDGGKVLEVVQTFKQEPMGSDKQFGFCGFYYGDLTKIFAH